MNHMHSHQQVSLTVSLLNGNDRSNSMKQAHGAESDERQKQKDEAIARRKELKEKQVSNAASSFLNRVDSHSNQTH